MKTENKLIGLLVVLFILALVPRMTGVTVIRIISKALIFGIAALGLNLLLGYGGYLSFGHALYIGIGAYTAAMTMKYYGITSLGMLIPLAIGFSVLVALPAGLICLRREEMYFGILTMGLGQVGWALTYKLVSITGGASGIRLREMVSFFGYTFNGIDSYYYFVLVIFFLCTVAMWLIVESPFGRILQATRDNENRAKAMGVQVYKHRIVAYVISAVFCAIAGALLAGVGGFYIYVHPGMMSFSASGSLVAMAILGGIGSLIGPIVGAFVIQILQYLLMPIGYVALVFGLVIAGTVLFFRGGITGGLRPWMEKILKKLGIY